ncbi:MAG: MraY family glycosyltransferase, partial [Mariprofundales bacterium]
YTSLFLSLLVTAKSPQIANYIGAVDHPDERKAHQHVIPRLGGLGIAVALFVSLPLFMPIDAALIAFLVGAIVISATGLFDDALQISPLLKFIGQIVAVLLFLFIADVRLVHFGDLIGIGNLSTGSFALPITVVCMVGVINALNLSDGLDGLAGGLSAIAAAFLAVLAYSCHNLVALNISVALFSAILGFLRYNSYPAKLFMGDTGSLLLGYSLAAIAVLIAQPASTTDAVVIAPITVALVLALPIVDTVLVMLRRIWKGDSPFLPDKTHLHHRLMALGFPHAAVVPLMYMIMVIMGSIAVLLHNTADWIQLLMGTLIMFAVFFSITICQYAQAIWQPMVRKKTSSFHRNKIYYRITVLVGKSMPWLLAFFVIGLMLPVLFVRHLPFNMEYYLLAMAVLFAALYPWRAQHGHSAIVHGLFYLSCVIIILLLNLNQESVPWMEFYLKIISVLVLVWVLLKLLFKRHTEVFLTSGFELLIIFISWFIPMIVLPQLHASEELIDILKLVCIEAIPFFLAIKILIREQPRRNHTIAIAMVFVLVLLSGKGFLL